MSKMNQVSITESPKMKQIMVWKPDQYRYIGQVQHKKNRNWYLVCGDSYNYGDGTVVLTRLLGGEFGQPFGPSQPRSNDQLVRLYGPIEHADNF